MMQSFEEATKFGKEFMETGAKSFGSLSKGLQAIAAEATEYSRRSYETGTAAVEKLVAAKSLDTALEIQTAYAKTAYEGYVAQATKLTELYAGLAKEAYKPFESVMPKAK